MEALERHRAAIHKRNQLLNMIRDEHIEHERMINRLTEIYNYFDKEVKDTGKDIDEHLDVEEAILKYSDDDEYWWKVNTYFENGGDAGKYFVYANDDNLDKFVRSVMKGGGATSSKLEGDDIPFPGQEDKFRYVPEEKYLPIYDGDDYPTER